MHKVLGNTKEDVGKWVKGEWKLREYQRKGEEKKEKVPKGA